MRNRNEMRIYGRHAVLMAFKKRPADIIRMYLTHKEKQNFSAQMKWLAKEKKAYHIVTDEELSKITDTDRHSGVCIIILRPVILSLLAWQKTLKKNTNELILCLEGVENPHNLGAIMRSAAHFGVKTILTSHPEMALTGAAFKVAEGGGEFIQLVDIKIEKGLMAILKKYQFLTIATSSHKRDHSLYKLSEVTKQAKKIAIFLGEERDGLKAETLNSADVRLTIPGSDCVESLNVASTSAILLSHFYPCISEK